VCNLFHDGVANEIGQGPDDAPRSRVPRVYLLLQPGEERLFQSHVHNLVSCTHSNSPKGEKKKRNTPRLRSVALAVKRYKPTSEKLLAIHREGQGNGNRVTVVGDRLGRRELFRPDDLITYRVHDVVSVDGVRCCPAIVDIDNG